MPNKLDSALKATSSLFKLVSGLYIVRMTAQKAGQKHNPVTLSQAPSEGGCVDFFPAEKVLRNTLVNPGDCIVLRVKGDHATLIATEFHEGLATPIKLQVERIDQVTPVTNASKVKTNALPKSMNGPIKGLRSNVVGMKTAANEKIENLAYGEITVSVVGHLQNYGDVVVKNDWLGKPGSADRLEGFAIKTAGLPEGINLVYGCKFQSAAYKAQMSKEGKFVGTRRKAQGIQSVVFALEGEGADQFQIAGDVAFSEGIGCHIVENTELKGPQGTEHLVAINLKIIRKPQLSQVREVEAKDDGLWSDDDIAELFSL